jgi:hypothetical protein
MISSTVIKPKRHQNLSGLFFDPGRGVLGLRGFHGPRLRGLRPIADRLLADLAQAVDDCALHRVDRGHGLRRIAAFGQAEQLLELLQELRVRFELSEHALKPLALRGGRARNG